MTEFLLAQEADVPEAIGLISDSGLPTSDLLRNNQLLFVLRKDERIIATCVLEIYQHEALFRSFAVLESQRNMGLGTEIYLKIIYKAKFLGIKRLVLLTTTAEKFFVGKGWLRMQRKDVSPSIEKSAEFTSICPSSAVCMYLILNQ